MTVLDRVALAPGYFVPRLIIGGWQFAEGHSASGTDRSALFGRWARLVDAGLDTFDCADIYTGVEALIGEFVRHSGRTVQVHTKFVPDRSALPKVDRDYVTRIVDRSLIRLGLERLDLVQFHWWDYAVPGMAETAGWLDELRQAGKIRNLGVTNTDVTRLAALADAGIPIVSNQVQYSLLDRRPEHGMADWCIGHDVRLLCYGTVAGGFLSERWLSAKDPAEFENRSLVKYRLIIEECGGWAPFQRLLAALDEVATRHGVTIANVAQRYVLERKAVAAVIVGMRSERSARANLASLALRLEAADYQAIAAAQSGLAGPAGEVYELERQPGSRHAAIMRYDLNTGGA
jgi:aryl-alcohol dehydrogenase-like predicted oxidoreductase